jgi:ferredoxin-NADP reductase
MQEIALRRRQPVAEGTFAFHFDKPAGFSHQAGQNALFGLPGGTESRTFTIASAPHEPELMVATRMRDSAFKRSLAELEVGDEVEVEQPKGDFALPLDTGPEYVFLASLPIGAKLHIDGPAGLMVLHEDESRPAVFLAGGIGITPFLAMARDATARRLPHRITLFYSNRRPQDAAFLAELEHMESRTFRMVATMTDDAGWKGENRRISQELLAEHVPDLLAPVYYFAGPPGMTMAVQGMLQDIGISEEDMRSEEFYGY